MLCLSRKSKEKNWKTQKILLLGIGESGKTTIIKQMKILHINGFSDDEKREKIPFIFSNIQESIFSILDNMDKIEPPITIKYPDINKSVEYLKNLGLESPENPNNEYWDHIEKVWTDPGVQEAFKRSNEYQLIDSTPHFLNRIHDIRRENYIPSLQDILFCRIKTTSISEIEFQMPVPKKYGGGKANFLMYDVGGQRGQRKKWIQLFNGIEAILFLIATSDFDLKLREDPIKNRLEEALNVFKDIFCSRFLRDTGLIVFLNKQDILKQKIQEGRKIEHYFPDYENFKKTQKGYDNEYEIARLFIKNKITEIANIPLTVEFVGFIPNKKLHEELPRRKVYTHFTIATNTNNIKLVFDSVHHIILEKNVRESLF